MREDIYRLSRSLAFHIPDVRWIPEQNLHLTLAFLGNVESRRIAGIQDLLDKAPARYLPITARFGGLGSFPNQKRPRIIWLGVMEGSKELIGLAEDLNRGLEILGFEPERKRFAPHLTLGRVKRGSRTSELREALKKDAEKSIRGMDSLGSLNINMILLMKSTLTSRGAIYQILSRHGN